MKELLDNLKNMKYSIKLLTEDGIENIVNSSQTKVALFVLNGLNLESLLKDILQSSSELRVLTVDANELKMIRELVK